MSETTIKAAMTRRLNAMFAALKMVEWRGAPDGYTPMCPACGGLQPTHQDVEHPGNHGKDAMTQPCPVAYALSEEASAEITDEFEVTRQFLDSRFLRRKQFDVAAGTS